MSLLNFCATCCKAWTRSIHSWAYAHKHMLCSRTHWEVCSVAEPMAKEGVLHMVSALPWLATSLKRSPSAPLE